MGGAHSRIAKNISLLVGSSSVAGVCAIAALGFNTRSLGAHDFGVLSLIQAFVALVSNLSSFESWQPIVRLGARMPGRVELTLASGLVLDFGAACVATIFAIVCVSSFGDVFGLSKEYQGLAAIYSMSLIAGVAGTPKGYFRLKQEFKVLAGNQAALAVTILVASILLWWMDAVLRTYIIVFAVVTAAYNLSLVVRMMFSMRKEGRALRLDFSTKNERRHLKLMLRMATGNSFLSSLVLSRRHIALFVVGYVLGESSAGIYSVAARIVTAVSKFALLLNQVLFSEVMKGAAEVEARVWRDMVLKVSGGGMLVSLVMALLGVMLSNQVVTLVGGNEYLAAAPVFALLFLSECIGLAGIHFNPIIQQKFGTWPLVKFALIGLLIFIISGVSLTILVGIQGAAIGVVVSSIVVYVLMLAKVRAILGVSMISRGAA